MLNTQLKIEDIIFTTICWSKWALQGFAHLIQCLTQNKGNWDHHRSKPESVLWIYPHSIQCARDWTFILNLNFSWLANAWKLYVLYYSLFFNCLFALLFEPRTLYTVEKHLYVPNPALLYISNVCIFCLISNVCLCVFCWEIIIFIYVETKNEVTVSVGQVPAVRAWKPKFGLPTPM